MVVLVLPRAQLANEFPGRRSTLARSCGASLVATGLLTESARLRHRRRGQPLGANATATSRFNRAAHRIVAGGPRGNRQQEGLCVRAMTKFS